MTNEEAIKMFKDIIMAEIDRLPHHYDAEVDDDVYDDTSRVNEILELNKIVSKALEKQVPKKPLDDFSTRAIYDNDGNYLDQLNTMTFECPICNNILASGEISVTDCDNIYYCEKCGQRLNWEKKDDE